MGKILFGQFVRSNFEVVRTSATALLLLILESHLESQFVCPADVGLGTLYSLVFILAPCFPLLSLHIRLSTHCTFSEICCKKSSGGENDAKEKDSCCSSCCYYVFEILYALTMPLCWILIVVIDGRYITCFNSVYQGNGTTSTVSIIQMSGLATTCGILTLLLIKPCNGLVECWWKRSCVQIYHRKKHEHLTLEEVKTVADEMVKDKRKDYVNGVIDKKCSLNMEDRDTLIGVHTVIQKSKEDITKNLAQGKKASGESSNKLLLTSSISPQTTNEDQPQPATADNGVEDSTGGGTGGIEVDTTAGL